MRITLKIAVIILAIFSTHVFSQIDQTSKPKAFVFDEFGRVTKTEWKKRIAKYRVALEKQLRPPENASALLVFYGENNRVIKQSVVFTRDYLYENCRDCFGFDQGITFVNVIAKKRKVQFWIIPAGADWPIIN